jgi:hypothetical protein
MFHVKHRRARLGRQSSLRKDVSRETALDRRVGVRKHEKCKTTPCIKELSSFINDMTLCRFGPSETVQRPLQGAQRRDSEGECRSSWPALLAAKAAPRLLSFGLAGREAHQALERVGKVLESIGLGQIFKAFFRKRSAFFDQVVVASNEQNP